ncbi:formylmethanofuran dehydrogenase [Cupriavidus sp. SK-3]|uniref:formylmethanofuran dehydrogenase subunit C n=1 Tax=unclassified Cupriavidus TaxID=2640874 RepID=UPI00044912F0|nr:formylmethanofuran dehydrogenase subunit C [Cupriavidus sp. SK-3]KDP84079.1 formylmethanofuran dehydrogenase [Cupriavidus sp. SK-3]
MSGLTLRLANAPALRVDLRQLTPAALAGMAPDAIARLPLWHGNERIALGELFTVQAHGGDGEPALTLEGDLGRFDRIGWRMSGGTLRVDGNAGDYLGCGMQDGTLRVNGNAGDFAAAALAGGKVVIGGNAGDFAAAALPGDMDGMRGGTLVIGGNTGDRFGDRMRRGTAMVAGNTGDFTASRMVAGTIAVAGAVGTHLAYGMRRGTIVLLSARPQARATFVRTDGNFDVFWTLLARHLARAGGPFTALPALRPRRLVGDLAVDGRGELLIVD